MNNPLAQAILRRDHAYAHHKSCSIKTFKKILMKKFNERTDADLSKLVKKSPKCKVFQGKKRHGRASDLIYLLVTQVPKG